MSTLYIYLDESGNFDFTNKGTRHFVLAALLTRKPAATQANLQALRYQLLEAGTNIEYFHASEDRQKTRDCVFGIIQQTKGIDLCLAYVEKRSLEQKLHDPGVLYSHIGKQLLDYCLESGQAQSASQLIIIVDKSLRDKERGLFKSMVKARLKPTGKSHRIYFHQVIYDMNAQIADYGAWSLYVSLERGETRPLETLGPLQPTILKSL